MFVYMGKEYIQFLKKLGQNREVATAQEYIDKMIVTVIEHGYYRDWFLRAYDVSFCYFPMDFRHPT